MRWLAALRVALTNRCGYQAWACADGWYCGGCGRDWDIDGRLIPTPAPDHTHTSESEQR